MTEDSTAAQLKAAGAMLDSKVDGIRASAAQFAASYAIAARRISEMVDVIAANHRALAAAIDDLNQAAAEGGLPEVCPPVDIPAIYDQALADAGTGIPEWLTFTALVARVEAARG